jgi:hypothetical protein
METNLIDGHFERALAGGRVEVELAAERAPIEWGTHRHLVIALEMNKLNYICKYKNF